jgi:type I restriction enzyme M protein
MTTTHNSPTLFGDSTIEREGIVSVLSSIHNNLYANDGLSPEQALEETVKLLFIKFLDEANENTRFTISREEQFEIASSGKCESFDRRLTSLATSVFKGHADLFEPGTRLKLKTSSLAFAVGILEPIVFSKLPHDVKGAAFQVFLNASQRVGRGQFFTPEPIVEFCVNVLNPSKDEVVVDPACGSGGFLSSAFLHSYSKSGPCTPIGFEISTTAARLARMRMLLLGATSSQVFQTDALLPVSALASLYLNDTKAELKPAMGFADVILTNPPFGTQGKINDVNVLREFELGHRWQDADSRSNPKEILSQQVPEILFIEQSVRLLKPGGRLGIVLPNGDFENSSLRYVRDFLLREMSLDGIVKLPQEAFIPSGTGIKTSLLFATKRKSGRRSSRHNQIFFGEVTKLGYSGNKTGTTEFLRDSNGEIKNDENHHPIIDEDFSLIRDSYLTRHEDRLFPKFESAYQVAPDELGSSRFDYEFHHPKYARLSKDLIDQGAIPLAEVAELVKSRPSVLSRPDAEVRYVELSDIGLEYQEIINCEPMKVYELPSRAAFQISVGQLLLAVAGNSIGTKRHVSAMVSPEFDGAICSNGFRVLTVRDSLINPYYLLFALSTSEVRQQVFRLRTGAAIPSISDTDLLSILIPRCPSDVEKAIASEIRNGFISRNNFRLAMDGFRNA